MTMIDTLEEILKRRTGGLGRKIAELIIRPIYANPPTELQAQIFEPTPKGARKVVLAANVAQISLTVDGIRCVIDSGFCKVTSYNPSPGMESLFINPISKAFALLRPGRSGRTGHGKCAAWTLLTTVRMIWSTMLYQKYKGQTQPMSTRFQKFGNFCFVNF